MPSSTAASAIGLRTYSLVTLAYWAFTVTDGALRMVVLLHFHELGYSPFVLSLLFVAYELMGVVTNIGGGWLGSRTGLERTLGAGLMLQVLALGLLSLHSTSWPTWAAAVFVGGVQAMSGVAKDLTKMSSKSAVKFVADSGSLFRWVALLTGSKNALKGIGFFVGAWLLSWIGYQPALLALAGLVAAALAAVLVGLRESIGRMKVPRSFRTSLAKSSAINRLSAARLFLFGARDIWFVVALPVFLSETLGWSFEGIGTFLAVWVIGYAAVQSAAPLVVRLASSEVVAARAWISLLTGVSAVLIPLLGFGSPSSVVVVAGLVVFGVVFAVNSSLHSYLILAYSRGDDVAIDVGFYYSANAAGRLLGTLLSGALYLGGGLGLALAGSTTFLAIAAAFSFWLPDHHEFA